jgi:hypothetical protein
MEATNAQYREKRRPLRHPCYKCLELTRASGPYCPVCKLEVARACHVLLMSRNDRAARAAQALRSGTLRPIPGHPGTWATESGNERQNGRASARVIYVTSPDSCTCLWGQNNPGPDVNDFCYHRMAATILAA